MNDDPDLLNDMDPDLNYFDEILSENCQCFRFNNVDEYLHSYSTLLSDNRFMTIFSQNIRSFNANLDSFLTLFPENSMPDVFIFCETWKDPFLPVLIPGYTGYHTTRQGRRSGGVSMFVKNNFTSTQIIELSYADNTIEICTVKVKFDNNYVSICGIYRPHSDTITNFCHGLEHVLNHNTLSNRSVLAGDYNIDLMSDCNEVSQFIDLMRSHHFFQVIDGITHPGVNNQTPSCIDHIWTNDLGGYNCGIVESGITDHHLIYYQFAFKSNKSNSNKIKIQFHEDNDVNKLFDEKISQFDWESIESDDLNQFYLSFVGTINRFYTECFPLKIKFVNKKYFQNPWHNSGVKKLSDARVRYQSLFQQEL